MDVCTVLLAGATGLVGGTLLDLLLADPAFRVITVGRRPVDRSHDHLRQVTVDLATLGAETPLPRADVAVSCLGTTLARAGSNEAFRAVDHGAVLAFARAAHAGGTPRALLVSALGANANARVFYNRVKGEAERDLAAVGFSSVGILQPSLLLGDRAERRPGERAAIVVSRVLAPLLRPFAARPIEAITVAHALKFLCRTPPVGVKILPSGVLHDLALQDRA